MPGENFSVRAAIVKARVTLGTEANMSASVPREAGVGLVLWSMGGV
jgi:hypothetical protein